MPIVPQKRITVRDFSDDYKRELFYIWYNASKPGPKGLLEIISSDPVSGNKPSERLIETWITNDFKPMALDFDQSANDQMRERAIALKVEMHERHAEVGKELQSMGIEFLREYGVNDAKTAVRAVIVGSELEAKNRGVGDILDAINKMTNDEVVDNIKKAFLEAKNLDEDIAEIVELSKLEDAD